MRINVASDLHLETYEWFPKFSPQKVPSLFKGLFDCDALVLAGDIASDPSMLHEWLGACPVPVVYVLGNHEYYGKSLNTAPDLFRRALKDLPHVSFLDRNSVVLHGIRFLGATLWTDMDRGHPLSILDITRSIRDFDAIEGLTSESFLERFRIDRDWLSQALSVRHDGVTVVVSHHGPTLESQHRAFRSSGFGAFSSDSPSRIGGAFVSDLSEIVLKHEPELWIHGHTHDSCDYRVGETRVLSNQAGYEWEESRKRFVAATIEIGDSHAT